MTIRWIQDGEPPLAGVYNRPLRDYMSKTGWYIKDAPNTIANGTDIRTLSSGSYYFASNHPQNPTASSATLLVQISTNGNATFFTQRADSFALYIATAATNPAGTLDWAEIYHSRNQLNIGNTAATARSVLGLGASATMNVGTTAGTIAAGNDSRIINAASVTYVNTGLNTKVNQSVQILPGDGMTGGGNLAGNRTLSVAGANRKNAVVLDFNALPDRFQYSGFVSEMSQEGSVNGPPSGTYYYVEQIFYSGAGNVTQIAYPYRVDSEGTWMRSRFSGTWSPWRMLISSNGGTITGALTVNGQVHGGGNANFNDVYIRSDIRDKKNFGNIDNALIKVNTLTGLTYEVLSNDGYMKSAGLIAQDVQKILPNAVGSSKNINDEDRLTLSYNAIVALLVESVKELTLKVEELEKK